MGDCSRTRACAAHGEAAETPSHPLPRAPSHLFAQAAKKAAKKGEDVEVVEAKPAEGAKAVKDKKAKAAAGADVTVKVPAAAGPSAASTPQMPIASPSKVRAREQECSRTHCAHARAGARASPPCADACRVLASPRLRACLANRVLAGRRGGGRPGRPLGAPHLVTDEGNRDLGQPLRGACGDESDFTDDDQQETRRQAQHKPQTKKGQGRNDTMTRVAGPVPEKAKCESGAPRHTLASL